MELFTLDSLLRRERVVDKFESLIWTERYNDVGEFELVLPSASSMRSYFQPNTWLALHETHRCMKVETSEDFTDEEGRDMTKISGPSIEQILDDRVAFLYKDDLTAHPKWTLTGMTPFTTAEKIFEDICRDGLADPNDVIPFLSNVEIFPPDGIQGPDTAITIELEPESVLNTIKALNELYDFGFRLVRNLDASQLVFNIYTGSDRTSGQSIRTPVIFSPDLENLKNPSELTSINGAKNLAYVYSPVGFQEVVPEDVDPNIEGFERQILVVKADDITDSTPAIATQLMIQRGKEELSKHRNFGVLDGEISQNSQYVYDRDYYLGDLVETRNSSGYSNYMRVTEQIFVSDREGDRAYPTLMTKQFNTPGSWASWPLVSWIDYEGDPFAWADAP